MLQGILGRLSVIVTMTTLEANAALVLNEKLQDVFATQLANKLVVNLMQDITWIDWVREMLLNLWLHLTHHGWRCPSKEEPPNPILPLAVLGILLWTFL